MICSPLGGGRADEVQSALRKHAPRPIAELAECAQALQRATYRLRGAWIIAPYWLGGERDSWATARDLRSWTRVAMGEIADVPGQILGTEGEAPEPPGGWERLVAALVAEREAEEASRAGLWLNANDY